MQQILASLSKLSGYLCPRSYTNSSIKIIHYLDIHKDVYSNIQICILSKITCWQKVVLDQR